MSFAQSVKQEILQTALEPCEEVAFLSALFGINGQLKNNELVLKSVSMGLIQRIVEMIKKRYNINVRVQENQELNLNKRKYYHAYIDKPEAIIYELGLFESESYGARIDEVIVQSRCAQIGFLKGAFLASGSLNSPKSASYHLEITTHQDMYNQDLNAIFEVLGVKTKTLKKRNHQYINYIKESEKIADFLRLIETNQALFEFEDERIKRDFNNSITRVMNIEIANQNKILKAADKQLENIAILENLSDTNSLPEGLQEAISLRKSYPELSLIELTFKANETLNKTISKSGLNHRFRQIEALASEAMENYHEKNHRH
jgi:DNA-binding protein WhiA